MDCNNALIYDFEGENAKLREEIFTLLYKRDVLDREFVRIVEELNFNAEVANKDGRLKEIVDSGVRLKEVADRIRYYDMLIDDCRKHIEHNNRLMKKD